MVGLNILVILATLLSYLSPFVNPLSYWQFTFFGLVYPWLLLSNILFIIYWIFRKKKYALVSLVCVVLGWGHVTSFVGLNFFPNNPSPQSISLFSYNIGNLEKVRKLSKTERAKKEAELSDFIKSIDVFDLICLQEEDNYNAIFLRDRLPNHKYKHSIQGKGVSIFSKNTIHEKGMIDFGKTGNSCVWADIKLLNKMVRVYSIHFQSNRVSTDADMLWKEGDLRKKESWGEIKTMMKKFKYFTQKRIKQVEMVKKHIEESPYPVIVAGDFNDTPQSHTYHLLTELLTDAFKKAGRGLGITYAGKIPALRIDYILTDKKMKVHNYQILKENFSDHYPVSAEISW